MKFFVLFAAAVLSTGNALSQPKVIAHRGFWTIEGSAQNSLRSLEEACRIECYGSEFDVRLTGDNAAVIFHDDVIKDAHGKGYTIEDTPYSELRNLTLPNGETLPTLGSYLALAKKYKNTKPVIELKTGDDLPPERQTALAALVLETVKNAGLHDRAEYIAFSIFITKELIRLDPDAKVHYLNGDLTPAQLKEIGCTGLDYEKDVLKDNPSWIGEAHRLGLETNVWTVNTPADMEYFISQNIDCITTDHPDKLQNLIR